MDKVKAFNKLAHYIAAGTRGTLLNIDIFGRSTFDAHRQHIKFSLKTAEEKHQFIDLAVAAMAALIHLAPDTIPEELADRITDLYRRKNADYGDAFARSLDKYGIVAALVRINDKVNRIESLTAPGREAQVKDEPILDTLLDLASYAIMTVMWIEEYVEDKTIGSNSLGSKSR